MIKYNGKEYRNLQEQVAKNKEDIEWLKEQPAVDGYTKAQADDKFMPNDVGEGLQFDDDGLPEVIPMYQYVLEFYCDDSDTGYEYMPHFLTYATQFDWNINEQLEFSTAIELIPFRSVGYDEYKEQVCILKNKTDHSMDLEKYDGTPYSDAAYTPYIRVIVKDKRRVN